MTRPAMPMQAGPKRAMSQGERMGVPWLPFMKHNGRGGKTAMPQLDDTATLLQKAGTGDVKAVKELFSRHRTRLRRMVQLRISPLLRGRIDASDVIQESFLEAWRRLDQYLQNPSMPFFIWLRFLTRQQLCAIHNRHAGVKARDPRREVTLYEGALPEASSAALAFQLLGQQPSPSEAAARAELRIRLQEGLDALEPEEREILALRHFEQLTNSEAARELKISEAAAAKRYFRALRRLKGLLLSLGFDAGTLQ
jgi:RNA polymerase sigma-70 factor, ECF subfamily